MSEPGLSLPQILRRMAQREAWMEKTLGFLAGYLEEQAADLAALQRFLIEAPPPKGRPLLEEAEPEKADKLLKSLQRNSGASDRSLAHFHGVDPKTVAGVRERATPRSVRKKESESEGESPQIASEGEETAS
jgi:hypothetical protein